MQLTGAGPGRRGGGIQEGIRPLPRRVAAAPWRSRRARWQDNRILWGLNSSFGPLDPLPSAQPVGTGGPSAPPSQDAPSQAPPPDFLPRLLGRAAHWDWTWAGPNAAGAGAVGAAVRFASRSHWCWYLTEPQGHPSSWAKASSPGAERADVAASRTRFPRGGRPQETEVKKAGACP